MWAFILRRLLYNIPVYMGILLILMAALRVNDPIPGFLPKHATREDYRAFARKSGLDQPFFIQYVTFLGQVVTLDFSAKSWSYPSKSVGDMLAQSIGPSLAISIPTLTFTTIISICIGLFSAYFRGRSADRITVFLAVLGMCISYLVYIILGQYFGAYKLNQWLGFQLFAISGYEPGPVNWPHYCLLPVMIGVIVGMGYDTRFYRAVIVEETTRDYITTAQAKGATKRKILFIHVLKNALIPIITRVVITLPFLISGSILLETYFRIPGMGQALIMAVEQKDFPIIQAFTAVLAALYIIAIILTDVLYAVVDPRVRLS